MTTRFSRRDFLRIAVGAAGVTATAYSSAISRELLEPFVQPPETALPGEATWYASTCRQCSAGCGIIVRTINGRAKKIEGNPLHPLNQGKLCARGQAGLQVLYNPDRLRNAVQQTGGRGSRQFEPVYWTDALDLLVEKVSTLGSPERLAFLGGTLPDHTYALANGLLAALGAPAPVIFDLHAALEGRSAAQQMSQVFFGAPELPVYDLAEADVILSFGANFLETWLSPVAQSRAFGTMRQGRFGGRGFFVQLEPRLSATAACADEWLPVRPGTEGFIALALGRIIVEENLGHVGSQSANANLYRDIDVTEMASVSQVPPSTLQRLARTFADAEHPVAIPGGSLSGQSNGFDSMLAVQALNYIIAQIGRTGGVFLSQPGPLAALRQPPMNESFVQVLELIDRMKSGQVDVLLIQGANPAFDLPPSAGFAEAVANVPFVVSFSPVVDETAVLADLILPDHTYLEAWGYQVPMPGADRPVVSGQQPVVRPLYDTRSTASVLLALASRLGGAAGAALPWASEEEFLQQTLGDLFGSSLSAYDAATQAGFWALWRQHGGWWSERAIPREPTVTEVVTQPLPMAASDYSGSSESYPFYLYPYPSPLLSDGRGASQSWLQETPDPMTTARWGTWVELNPATARLLRVSDNDIVRITSPFGVLEAPVVVYPGIHPDVVAIPVGEGHQDYGRFASQRGSSPISLLAPMSDPNTGGLAWAATRVRVEKTSRTQTLARWESLDGEGRESLG